MRTRRGWLWLGGGATLLLGVALLLFAWTRAPEVSAPSWLHARVGGELPVRSADALVDRPSSAPSLFELREVLRRAAGDPRLLGVLLEIEPPGIAPAALGELVELLDHLRGSQKRVLVHARRYDFASWLLASHAQSISLHPLGAVDLRSPNLALPFIGDALRAAGFTPDLVRAGEDQACYEQLTASEPNEKLAAQTRALHARWLETLRGRVHAERKDAQAVARLGAAGPIHAQRALEERWVDHVEDDVEFERRVQEEAPAAIVEFERYRSEENAVAGLDRDPTIAVLVLDGIFLDGESRSLPVVGRIQGLDELRSAVAEIRANPDLRGVIVRIASDGGEALACDAVWRELDRLREDLPLVALLGGRATAGGYYAALACERIYCQPETITGVVGIVGGRILATQLLSDRGVAPFVVAEPMGSAPSHWAPLDENQRAALRKDLDEKYNAFLERLRLSRSYQRIDSLAAAGGRAYLGLEAREMGLVDDIGGWQDAWRAICKEAEIQAPERATFVVYPRTRRLWDYISAGDLPLPSVPLPEEVLHALGTERAWFLGPLFEID